MKHRKSLSSLSTVGSSSLVSNSGIGNVKKTELDRIIDEKSKLESTLNLYKKKFADLNDKLTDMEIEKSKLQNDLDEALQRLVLKDEIINTMTPEKSSPLKTLTKGKSMKNINLSFQIGKNNSTPTYLNSTLNSKANKGPFVVIPEEPNISSIPKTQKSIKNVLKNFFNY